MNTEDKEFQKRLLATFKTETKERLKILSAGFLALEKKPSEDEKEKILEVIYREAHSLKGDARSVNVTEIDFIFRPLETVLDSLKRGDFDPRPEMFETLYLTLDTIDKLITSSEDVVKVSELIEALSQLSAGKSEKPLKSPQPKPRTISEPERAEAPKRHAEKTKGEPETERISKSKLDELFRQTE